MDPETNPAREVWAPFGAFCFGSAPMWAERGGIDHENGPARPFFCRSRSRKSERVRTTAEKQRLIELLEPAVVALGYELVDIDLRIGRHGLLRLYIDRRSDADGSVTLADCELVSGQVGALLDVEDPLPGAYDLEVSSPGLDRKLRTPAHFERFVGRDVRVELAQAREGRKRLKGRLDSVEGGAILMDVDGTAWRVELADIAEARLVPE